jgi:hypothetical protein
LEEASLELNITKIPNESLLRLASECRIYRLLCECPGYIDAGQRRGKSSGNRNSGSGSWHAEGVALGVF